MNGSPRTTTPAATSSGPAEPAIQHPAYRRMWLASLLLLATQALPFDANGREVINLAVAYGKKSARPPFPAEFAEVMGLTVTQLMNGPAR
jgi:hypothetical protein